MVLAAVAAGDRKEPSVHIAALALALAAAGAHAAWNVLAKRAGGGVAFVFAYGAAGVVLWAPLGLGALALGYGRIDIEGCALMAGSGALHAAYFVLLQRGYATGDLSLVYPLARGTGPLLAVPLAAVALDQRPDALDLAGGAVIVAAVLSLTGRPRAGARAAIGFALATGALIASYTVWDAYAVNALDLTVVTYFWGAELSRALLLAPVALRRWDRVQAAWSDARGAVLGIGLLSPLAYVLVLWALTLAPVSLVAPTREVGIVLGAALGASLLGEPAGIRRVAAAIAVVAGIALLAL
jgi:drug/metabolite transporter (DMT)-like permease